MSCIIMFALIAATLCFSDLTLSAHTSTSPYHAEKVILCGFRRDVLTPEQVQFCIDRSYMYYQLTGGSRQAWKACRKLFEYYPWGCRHEMAKDHPLGFWLGDGSREDAYSYALRAGGMALEGARGCESGFVSNCGCRHFAEGHTDDKGEEEVWKWEGCPQKLDYAIEGTRAFLSSETRNDSLIDLMARNNEETGYQVARESRERICKCHGLSGSCELKVCWWQLKRTVMPLARTLKIKYEAAKQTTPEVLDKFWENRISSVLEYLHESKAFCELHPPGKRSCVEREGEPGCRTTCCGSQWTNVLEEEVECRRGLEPHLSALCTKHCVTIEGFDVSIIPNCTVTSRRRYCA